MGNEATIGAGKLKILVITGSLRKASTNTGLLKACIETGHPNLEFVWAEVKDIPMFNEDLEADVPKSVVALKEQLKHCDGVLMGLPEYNSSFTPVSKNVYDWLSRNGSINEYPVALVSSGADGGSKVRKAFLQVGQYCKVKFMPGDTLAVKRYGGAFDDHGSLISAEEKAKIPDFLQRMALFVFENRKKSVVA